MHQEASKGSSKKAKKKKDKKVKKEKKEKKKKVKKTKKKKASTDQSEVFLIQSKTISISSICRLHWALDCQQASRRVR